MSRPLVLAHGRSPFQVLLMVACVISGVAGLLPHDASGAIDLLAEGYVVAWYLGLIAGGIAALAALVLKIPTSLLVERAALCLLAGLFLAYGSGLYLLLGMAQVRTGGVIIVTFGVACAACVHQIGRDLARLRRALADPVSSTDTTLADPDHPGPTP